jgi:hypothetical protein
LRSRRRGCRAGGWRAVVRRGQRWPRPGEPSRAAWPRGLDVLDLDGRALDAPRLRLLVDDLLQVLVEAVALGEQLVEAERERRAKIINAEGEFQNSTIVFPLRLDMLKPFLERLAPAPQNGAHAR